MTRKHLLFLLKAAISAGLIVLLFTKVHFEDFFVELKKIDAGYFLLAVLVLAGGWWISAKRWGILLLSLGLPHHRTARLFANVLVGMFYSIVLPAGKLAGDVVRAYQIAGLQNGEQRLKHRAFLSVFIDRGIGVLAFLIFISGYFIIGQPDGIFGLSRLVVAAVFLLTVLGLIFIFSDVFDPILRTIGKLPLEIVKKFISFLFDCLKLIRHDRMTMAKVVVISLAVVFLSVMPAYIFSSALGLEVGFWTLGAVVSLATLLIMIPITIAGIGLREGALLFLLVQIGVPAEAALAIAVLNLAVIVALAMIGGLLELYHHFK